jgi:histidinol-phosphate aminotransferase
VRRIQKTRGRLTRELKKTGFTVLPSQANFVMARRPGENLKDLYLELKRRRILVRYFDRPELQDALRITIGTPEEIKTLCRELKDIIAGSD